MSKAKWPTPHPHRIGVQWNSALGNYPSETPIHKKIHRKYVSDKNWGLGNDETSMPHRSPWISLKTVTANTKKSICSDFWISGKVSLKDRIHPKWSLVAQAATQLILGGLRCFPQKANKKSEEWTLETWKSQNSQRCAPENRRDRSGWNHLNLNGMPFGDEKDSLISMDYQWKIHGYS